MVERRYDTDGNPYTQAEFERYYGGLDEWRAAAPESSSGGIFEAGRSSSASSSSGIFGTFGSLSTASSSSGIHGSHGSSGTASSSGGIFTLGNSSTASSSGSIFGTFGSSSIWSSSGGILGAGSSGTASSSGGIFGTFGSSSIASSSGVIFEPYGSASTASSSGGIFGDGSSSSASSSSGIFGTLGSSSAASASGGAFELEWQHLCSSIGSSSGGIFGARSLGTASSSSGISGTFGSSSTASSSGSIFGAGSSTVASSSGSIFGTFGSSSIWSSSGGIFGAGSSGTASSSGGIFGTFGSSSIGRSSGGIFGTYGGASTASSSGGIFGEGISSSARTSGGIFGTFGSVSTASASGGICGAGSSSVAGSIGSIFGTFGSSSIGSSSGGIFGAGSSGTASSSGGIFGTSGASIAGNGALSHRSYRFEFERNEDRWGRFSSSATADLNWRYVEFTSGGAEETSIQHSGAAYLINFRFMTQTNQRTGTTRAIRITGVKHLDNSQKLAACEKELASYKLANSMLQQALHASKESNETLQAMQDSSGERLATCEQELARCKVQLEETTGELQACKLQLEDAENELIAVSETSASSIEALKADQEKLVIASFAALHSYPRAASSSAWWSTALDEEDARFAFIATAFKGSLQSHRLKYGSDTWCEVAKVDIDSIKLVANPYLQSRYELRLQRLDESTIAALKDIDAPRLSALNEFLLYHGASEATIENICDAGFDPRRAGEGAGRMFGSGTYFASAASKADLYSSETSQSNCGFGHGFRQQLLTRVCLGNAYCAVSHMRDAAHAPYVDSSRNRMYDSVLALTRAEGGAVDFREYVAFDGDQCLPFAIIKYKHKEDCCCRTCRRGI